MQERLYNFSAGPAVLPVSVLQKAQKDLVCLPGAGASIMEISHRSKTFDAIIKHAEANIRSLLNIPENYKVLFLQGGALTQFALIAMNLMTGTGKSADYIVTGTWSKKAASEAATQGTVNTVWNGKDQGDGFRRKPAANEYTLNPDAAYCYICANETIEGIQWKEFPKTNDVPLIADCSSEIFSRPVDINKFGILYACAQKNAGPAGVTVVIIREDLLDKAAVTLPSMFSYKKMSDAGSMLNTPPCFAIYMLDLVTNWLINDIGGLDKMYQLNQEKAAILYDTIDNSNGYFKGHANKEFRSIMNVPFRLPSEELDKKFIAEAATNGLMTLGGHRSVGGCRASIYNAMPKDGVIALCDFMKKFKANN